jgi:hypothetical protein
LFSASTLLSYDSHDSWNDRRAPPCTGLGWPGTMILLISASQVVRITGMSHWPQLHYLILENEGYTGPRMYVLKISQQKLKEGWQPTSCYQEEQVLLRVNQGNS